MRNNQIPDQPEQPDQAAFQQPTAPADAAGRQPAPPPIPPWAQRPARPSLAKRILLVLGVVVLVLSIMLNFYLAILIAGRLDGGFKQATITRGKAGQTIAVYKIQGVIDSQAVRKFSSFFDEVKVNPNVKAVVLRVNSHGGSVTASDQIHHLVGKLQRQGKKVVVSMGGVAASGGYYISASADEIFAEPTTITGSIGVVMAWPVIRGTLEKIGMETVVIKSRNARGWKDEASPLRPPAPHHREHLQELLDKIQAKFERIVLSGRGSRLKPRAVRYTIASGESDQRESEEITETEPFNGKVYLPDEAEKLGLIDAVGYLAEAIDRAAALAELDKPRVIRYDLRRSLLAELLQARNESLLNLSVKSFDEFQTPRLLMMWRAE